MHLTFALAAISMGCGGNHLTPAESTCGEYDEYEVAVDEPHFDRRAMVDAFAWVLGDHVLENVTWYDQRDQDISIVQASDATRVRVVTTTLAAEVEGCPRGDVWVPGTATISTGTERLRLPGVSLA